MTVQGELTNLKLQVIAVLTSFVTVMVAQFVVVLQVLKSLISKLSCEARFLCDFVLKCCQLKRAISFGKLADSPLVGHNGPTGD